MVPVSEVTAALRLQCEFAVEARGGSPPDPYRRAARMRAAPWGRSTSIYGRAAVPQLGVPGVSRPTRWVWGRLPGAALLLWSRRGGVCGGVVTEVVGREEGEKVCVCACVHGVPQKTLYVGVMGISCSSLGSPPASNRTVVIGDPSNSPPKKNCW